MNVRLDASKVSAAYASAFQRLRNMNGFKQSVILRAEMGSILKAWAGAHKPPSLAQTDLRTRVHVMSSLGFTGGKQNSDALVSVSAGLRGPFGRVWLRKKDGHGWRRTHDANFQPLNQHYKKGQWIDLQEAIQDVKLALAREIPKGRGARGLAQQSIVQSADQLGIDLGQVAGGGITAAQLSQAQSAVAANGRKYQNGIGYQTGNEVTCAVEAINRLPYNSKIGMDRSLLGVLARRAKFLETAYKKGAFDSIQREAAAFPNIFKVGGLAA